MVALQVRERWVRLTFPAAINGGLGSSLCKRSIKVFTDAFRSARVRCWCGMGSTETRLIRRAFGNGLKLIPQTINGVPSRSECCCFSPIFTVTLRDQLIMADVLARLHSTDVFGVFRLRVPSTDHERVPVFPGRCGVMYAPRIFYRILLLI